MRLSLTSISVLAVTGGIFLSALAVQAQDCIEWIFRTTDGPPARAAHASAYHVAREVTVVAGGSGGEGQMSDTWEWNGSTWILRPQGDFPGIGLSGLAMAYHSPNNVAVLLGNWGPCE